MNLPRKKLYILIAIAAISLAIFVALFSVISPASKTNSDAARDTTAPVITLSGEGECVINWGDTYIDPGFSAIDNVDGDITASVKVEGTINSKIFGPQLLLYTVADTSGNITSTFRMVSVQEFPRQTEEQIANPPGKVVYLTFDDGPSKYTTVLLDILDKYNVSATFFVTNQFSAYQDMIGETHRRGHTIAMHTYSHKFQNIYTSERAYYEDLNKIRAICEAQTGVTPKIVRFPGGTSNMISKKYCSGIMSKLSKSLGKNGYFYCDWNVDSNDAGGTKTVEGVAANVIAGIQKKDTAVVLQHDTYLYSIEAVEEIIIWGLANGYTFLPLTEESPMVHHPVKN